MGRQESAVRAGRGHPQSNKQEENTHTHTDTAWMRLVCATADQVVLDPTDASRDAEDEDEVSESSAFACTSLPDSPLSVF